MVFTGFSRFSADSAFFSENQAVSLFLTFWCLTSCKVSRKSLEPFSRKSVPQRQTDRQTLSDSGSTKVENCNVQGTWPQLQTSWLLDFLTSRLLDFLTSWLFEQVSNCVEPGWPHNGAGTKISSNFGFNMLTLRIGPFRNFEKKF